MDQNSRIEIDIIESQLRENYGKIVYSHKTQEKCADILAKQNKLIKNSQIKLSALITTGLCGAATCLYRLGSGLIRT